MTTDATPRLDDELTTRLLHHRVLVMGTELDEALGNRLCSALLLLAADDPERDITLLISSPGGSVPAMLALSRPVAGAHPERASAASAMIRLLVICCVLPMRRTEHE